MTSPQASLKVLSIVGAGRSGTTVLASILGEVEGFASAGELRWLWERGVRARRPCACGQAPTDCEIWSPVISRVLKQVEESSAGTTVDEIIAAQHEVARRYNFPRVLRAARSGHHQWPALELVQTVTWAACEAFADVTRARVVVDTSKRPVDAAVFAGLDGVDPYVLHIVRDPRAVVHSWGRPKTFTTGGETMTMGARGLLSSTRRWTSSGLLAEALRRQVPAQRWLHMRYEDFAASPRAAVEQVVALLGETGTAPFSDDRTVELRPNHIVAGNPSRFTTGAVTIRADEAWRRRMSRRDRALVETMTLPLMVRYGYVRPRVTRADAGEAVR